MTIAQTAPSTSPRPVRLWPGVVFVVLQCLLWFVLPRIVREATPIGFFGALLCEVAIILWWLFFSRAPWVERLGILVLMVITVYATSFLLHPSIRGGMMGMMFFIYVIPALSVALVVWAAATRGVAAGPRRAWIVAAVLLACGAFTLIRTEGITGDAVSALKLRWTSTPEERLIAEGGGASAAPRTTRPPSGADAGAARADWPGFRGPARDGVVHGVKVKTDWSATPPAALWRHPVGPGWSSFAVRDGLVYTQEQRGDDEVVSCYDLGSGEPVWQHADKARFWESNAGAGPRGTPTLDNGHVYTLGATGVLDALDAGDGSLIWTRNAATDTGAKTPGWGFAGSPLVVDGVVIVATAGVLAGYDAATGQPRWTGPKDRSGYSSPHLLTIDGVPQVLLLSGFGVTSVAPADGKILWEQELPHGPRIVQPAVMAGGDLLVHDAGYAGTGIHRLGVSQASGGWAVKEKWLSTGLKPYFNDFVVNDGYAYGFDGSILSCINLEDGKRAWKGGRYGAGQLLLLADQDLLLVLSEEGELALVKAAPDQFTEVARFPAIQGKTWNHPVVAGDVVLVRNDQEMAAFRLPLEGP